jgi:hypothetical protein
VEREHDRWRELILAHEDLGVDERAAADDHLAACEDCRALLARLRELEKAAAPRGQLPPLDTVAPALSPPLQAEADASLHTLRARLGLEQERTAAQGETARHSAGRRAPLRRLGVPLALAAGLVFVAVLARTDREQSVVRGLRILPFSADRGGAQSTATTPRPVWHTGDAFVLAFDLTTDSYPAVFHVGPSGEVSLLHPMDASAPLPRLAAGRGRELPLAGERSVWALEGAPGPETFLVAAGKRPDPGLPEVLADAQTLAQTTPRRQEVLAGLVRLLTVRLGPVQTVEVEHLP